MGVLCRWFFVSCFGGFEISTSETLGLFPKLKTRRVVMKTAFSLGYPEGALDIVVDLEFLVMPC